MTTAPARPEGQAAQSNGSGAIPDDGAGPDDRRLRRLPQLLAVAFRIVVTAAGRELVEVMVLEAVAAVGLAAQVLVVKSLLSHLVTHRTISFSTVLPELIALSLLTLVTGTVNAVLGLRSRLLAQLVARHATDEVARATVEVDLITFEHPGFHDQLQRAQQSAMIRPAAIVQELIGAAGAALSIGAIAVTLLILQPLFCLLIVIAYIPIWFATRRGGAVSYRQTVEQTQRERMRLYLFEALTTKESAQEVRAFGIGPFLADRHAAVFATLIDDLRVTLRRRAQLMLAGQLVTALLSAGALALLVWFVTSGRMSLATAGAAAGAMVLLSGRLHGLAGSTAGLYENSLYLEDYVRFVAAAPIARARRPTARPAAPPELVSAEAVSFTYPSRRGPSLQDASLVLRRGEVVALVGENGSGKTTFAKLLAGLYAPTTGTVRWDGVDTATLDPAIVRRHVAVIFQDFMRYLLPAHDNIALGDHERFTDRDGVREAARAAGIDAAISALPSGYETILGPAYQGGSDLSGGQWQRMALARLFFRDAPIVILDEPTSALDPRAEAELYASMRGLFAGRGVLLISHRFASVRTADRIYVLRDGRVHESGTHAELVAAGGYYAELYGLQASQYRD